MIEFGKSLRQAREAKGYTIAQVAEMTRMAPKTVTDLENENFSHIAAPIYGRGFVKLYCEALGLEAKPFVDEFMAIYSGEKDVGIRERTVLETPDPAPEPPVTAPEETLPPASMPAPPPPAPEPVTAPEPPPAPSMADFPMFSAAANPTKPAGAPAPAPEAHPSASLSRYATPVRKEERAPTLSPAIWRIGVLAAIAILIIWGAFLGVRALYRATSGNSTTTPEAPTEPVVTEEAPAPQPAEPDKSAKKDAKPEEPAPASAPRTPQDIPSIYID